MRIRNRMRALYLQPAPLFGGAERQAATCAALLPRCGVEVVPVVGPGLAIIEWLRERGVREVVHTGAFPGGWRKQRGLARLTLPFRYLTCGTRLRALVSSLVGSREIGVIVASLPFAWIVGTLVARRRGIPIVWRAGGARINAVQAIALWLVTRFLRPDLLLCTGEAVRRTFGPLVPASVRVVPNGVDTERFRPGAGNAERYRPPGARWVIGYAARLTTGKRPKDFLQLAARLQERFPGAHFLLAGDGSERRKLEEYARKAGAETVTFLGFVSDMPSFYAACDIVVLPSQAEGCPNFVLEAMGMGSAIVAAEVAPVLELVQHEREALTFPVGDLSQLEQRVTRLLQDPEERAVFGRRAREKALQFTCQENAQLIAATLRDLAAQGERRRARVPAADRLRGGLEAAAPFSPWPTVHSANSRILASDLPDTGCTRNSDLPIDSSRASGSGA
ncbi:MAG TPA: glycosyltransferase family 4 protein [Polyangiaceae bacterium]